jgi:hypothetical protein
MTHKEADQLCFAIAKESSTYSQYVCVGAGIDSDDGRPWIDLDARDLTADQLRRIAAVLDQVIE